MRHDAGEQPQRSGADPTSLQTLSALGTDRPMMPAWNPQTVLSLVMSVVLLGGCAASAPEPDRNPTGMTLAEMRLNDAGGPSKPATPAGLASPVASPTAPDPGALTDAGLNTPLGKQWVFTTVSGFEGPVPQSPRNASFLLSRESGRMVGTTMCNQMSATFEINMVQATLSFGLIRNTRMMCGEPNISVEGAVLNAISACDSFLLDGKNLKLISKGVTIAELVTK